MNPDSNTPSAEQAPTNRRWMILGLASSMSFFLYLHRYTWNMIRPELKKEYGFSNVELEGLFSLFNLTYAVGQIPSGIVCDLFGPHLFLVVILVLWSVTLPLFGLTGDRNILGSLRLLFGAAQAGCYPGLSKTTRNWFPLRTRTGVQGLVASFAGRGGGAMASIIMGTLLMGYCGLGWRLSLVVMMLAGLAFAAVFFFLFRNRPEDDPAVNEAECNLIHAGEESDSAGPAVLPFRRVARSVSMLVFIFQQFINAGADYVYVAILGSYFQSLGYTPKDMGLLISMPLLGGACGGVVGGFINDFLIRRTGSRRWSRTAVGFVGKALAAGCLLIAINQETGVAAAAWLFVVKFFGDWTQPTVWGTCTDIGGRYSATVFSIINTAGSLGMVITPFVGGFVLDHFATTEIINGVKTTITNYNPLFLLVVGMYLVSSVCWLFINAEKSLESE